MPRSIIQPKSSHSSVQPTSVKFTYALLIYPYQRLMLRLVCTSICLSSRWNWKNDGWEQVDMLWCQGAQNIGLSNCSYPRQTDGHHGNSTTIRSMNALRTKNIGCKSFQLATDECAVNRNHSNRHCNGRLFFNILDALTCKELRGQAQC